MVKLLPTSLMAACAVAVSLVPGAAAPAAAERLAGGPRDFIVNGVETQSRPTTGALLSGGGSNFNQICTGTLIGCETFLTAAHCVCPGSSFCTPNPSGFSVYLQHAGVLAVSAVDVHPSYAFGVSNDIAVVTLASPLDGVPPTPINTTGDPPHGTAGVIAGFGIVDAFSGDSGILREGQVTTGACGSIPEPAHVCWDFSHPIGPAGVDSNTCSGDSGGPLFANLGGGDVVIGVTSGGDSFSCLPPDTSFDTNVFQNAGFIDSIAGADLLNTTCGSISQVGQVGTTILAASSTAIGKSALKCRREVRKLYRKYTATVLKAEARCLDDIGDGSIAGPCPDAATSVRIGKAISKVDAAKLSKKCLDAVVPGIGFAGDCAGAADAGDLAACILSAGDTAVASMLGAAYADDAPAGPITEPTCQAAIGKAMVRYQKGTLKALNKCEDALDKRKVADCPDPKALAGIAKTASKVEPAIAGRCSDAQVAALDGAAGFGGSCAGSTTTADLATCEPAEYDARSLTLIGLIESADPSLAISFIVPPGRDRFRVTVNGREKGNDDIDVFVRLGAPPTTSVFDASSINGGMFDGVEVSSPAAGEWFVLVDEFSGNNIPAQLTVTIFSP